MENINPSILYRNKDLGYPCELKLCLPEGLAGHKGNAGWVVGKHVNYKSMPSCRNENFNHYTGFLIFLVIHFCVYIIYKHWFAFLSYPSTM